MEPAGIAREMIRTPSRSGVYQPVLMLAFVSCIMFCIIQGDPCGLSF